MAALNARIQQGLLESRILMLITQVIAGFEYRAVFEPGFERLSESSKILKLVGLLALLVSIGFLIYPCARHQLRERQRNSEKFVSVLNQTISLSLIPFGLALGLDLYVAASVVGNRTLGVAFAIVATAGAFFLWYALGAIARRRHPEAAQREVEKMKNDEPEKPKLEDRIKNVFTELRVALPGTQMLLGFQLATIFTTAFEKLPESSRIIHLVSLGAVALSAVLLMTPAAYHRIAFHGEDHEELPHFAGRFLMASLVPLALGMALDFYVVLQKVTHSHGLSIALAAATLLLFYAAWFVLPWIHGHRRAGAASKPPGEAAPATAAR